MSAGQRRPADGAADWARHIYRKLNGTADELGNKHDHYSYLKEGAGRYMYYRIFFEGSVAQRGAGGARVLYGFENLANDDIIGWTVLAEPSLPSPKCSKIMVCELEACVWGLMFMAALMVSDD